MIMYTEEKLSMLFGGRRYGIDPAAYKQLTSTSLVSVHPFSDFHTRMDVSTFVFLHQVHGKGGMVVSKESEIAHLNPFTKDGDFLVTNQPGIGLGIVTADCLPIVFIDKKKKIIGVAHAGWKGSAAHIGQEVLMAIQTHFSSAINDINIFFGPAAKSCCYEVDAPFIEQLSQDQLAEQAFFINQDRVTFDLALYNAAQLYGLGFKPEQLVFRYNVCTICNDAFCSYRRQKGSSERQVTVVSLK